MGMSSSPRSFGRPVDTSEDPVVVFPPIRLSPVQVPLELVVDPQSLAQLGAQIQEMVRTAVTAGLEEAMEEAEQAVEQALSEGEPAGAVSA